MAFLGLFFRDGFAAVMYEWLGGGGATNRAGVLGVLFHSAGSYIPTPTPPINGGGLTAEGRPMPFMWCGVFFHSAFSYLL